VVFCYTKNPKFIYQIRGKFTVHRNNIEFSAYGGSNWSARKLTLRDEIGKIWHRCGINTEYLKLRQVLLHPPGSEFSLISNADEFQMFEVPNWDLAREQHKNLVNTYLELGVEVTYLDPPQITSPNQIFCADLFFMTPEGAILGRPASTIRAGEERWVARRLADLGIPILRTLQGSAVFEGADALWVNPNTVLLGRGLRTNDLAISQIAQVLNEMGVNTITIDLPIGTMHLMGLLRVVDDNLVIVWPHRLAWKAIEKLKDNGYQVEFLPDEREATLNGALNFVTLEPRRILMPAGNPITQNFLDSHNVEYHLVDVDELQKAAGGVGCLTGILEREITIQS
jgi:N-dimethylarginine dimethylaminohydrolase